MQSNFTGRQDHFRGDYNFNPEHMQYNRSHSVIEEQPFEESNLSRPPLNHDNPENSEQSEYNQEGDVQIEEYESGGASQDSIVSSQERVQLREALLRPHEKDRQNQLKHKQKTREQLDVWEGAICDAVNEAKQAQSVQIYTEHQELIKKIKMMLQV